MNRSDFIRIINDPSRIDRQMTGEVKELLDLFPWFHSAHLLLLKGLHNSGDVKFENQLKQSAIHVADREVLYYILKKPVDVETEKPEIIETIHIIQRDQTENDQVVIESGKNSSDIINELEKESAAFTSAANRPPVEGNAHKEIIFVTTESDLDESASVILIIEDGDNHIEETVTFMDPSISIPGEEELLELEENIMDLYDDNVARPSETRTSPSEPETFKQLQAKLIDNFIMLNPRIEPPREKSDKPNEDISKPYVEEKGGLITETLARIYITQGYYSRAIDIYEKLSLKFPEKSSYFATQIEKVKELIK